MKLRPVLLLAFLFFSCPAEASIGARAGLPEGLSMGLGASGISLDGAVGALAVGGSIAGEGMSTNLLIPSLRAVWTVRKRENLSVGLVSGGTQGVVYASPTKDEALPLTLGRELIGDVGITASYQFDLPLLFDRVLPLTLTPTLTFKLDKDKNLAFGPQTNIELDARLSPDVELALGGGTVVGLRFRI